MSKLALLRWYVVARRFARGNSLVGSPHKVSGLVDIISRDKGNTVIIEDGVWLRNLTIEFRGSGNTVLLGSGCIPSGRFIVGTGGTIRIGEKTLFNKPCWFQAFEGRSIEVGKGCLFADIRVRTSDLHSILDRGTGERVNLPENVAIGDRVWIAEKAHIYKGVSIGSESVIGAHAVVVKDIPPNCVAVGCPAAVVRSNITWSRAMLPLQGRPKRKRSGLPRPVEGGRPASLKSRLLRFMPRAFGARSAAMQAGSVEGTGQEPPPVVNGPSRAE